MSGASRAGQRGAGRARQRAVDPASLNQEPYIFEHNGIEYSLSSFASLKSGLIRRIRNLDEADAFYTVLEEVADEPTLAAIDDMDMLELGEIMRAWQKHAGVSLGEFTRSSR